MPIYMDRHDLRGMKADDVAEAHRRDVDIQDRHGVKYMAYWFDESNGAAFCLVHAPDPETAERVHREAHGAIPNAIIPVNLATVEAFLGRISDPRVVPRAPAPTVDSGLRAVMFTDIVGSTEMTTRLGDSAAVELVRVHDALVRRGLKAYGGREIKHTGDGIMASFDNVADSVRSRRRYPTAICRLQCRRVRDAERSDRHRRGRTRRGPQRPVWLDGATGVAALQRSGG